MISEKELLGNLFLIFRYLVMLENAGVKAEQSPDGVGIKHAAWMLDEMADRLEAKDPAFDDGKCGRWMGFIQREIIGAGFTTVQAERDISRQFFRKV